MSISLPFGNNNPENGLLHYAHACMHLVAIRNLGRGIYLKEPKEERSDT